MKIKGSLGSRLFDLINGVIMIFVAIVMLYPMIYVILASVSDSQQLLLHPGLLYKPLGFNLEAYKGVLADKKIWTGYANTIQLVVMGTAVSVVLTAMGGFILSRKDFLLNKLIFPMVMIPMFFSGGVIQQFLVVTNLGLYNSIWSVILTSAIGIMNMFIMRSNFKSLPDGLEEAAMLDGANLVQYFVKIVLPLSKAVIAVMCLYYGVGRWNEWFAPMIYLEDKSRWPLQLYVRELLISQQMQELFTQMGVMSEDAFTISETLKYTVVVVATVPILCIYPFLQKYFVKGTLVGAVKE